MNQTNSEDDVMPMEQTSVGRERQFVPIPRDGVYNRSDGAIWFD